MRVIDNVLTGALGHLPTWKTLFGSYPTAEWEKAERILSEVGLEGLEDRRVETLSGGQRQRAAIARALMQDADIILADEPVSALDPELAEDALDLLVECVERRNMTLIVSLHQPALAKRFATRLVGLADGKIIYNGSPEGLTAEASDKVYRGTLPHNMMDATGPVHDTTSKTIAEKGAPPSLRVVDR
jgi:phosphonate transport system ATP-binding protein